jgi:hypothetical protein
VALVALVDVHLVRRRVVEARGEDEIAVCRSVSSPYQKERKRR